MHRLPDQPSPSPCQPDQRRRPPRPALVLAILLAGCDGSCNEALSWLPFDVPFLNTDAGLPPSLPLDAGPIDASAILFDGGPEEVAEGEECTSRPCAAGLQCVVVSTVESRCLRPCAAGCAVDQACEPLATGSFCLAVAQRGEHCETRSCASDNALRCLPARVEAARVLAYTCQRPCTFNPANNGGCPAGESCLPNTVGLLEPQGGDAGVACDPSACLPGVGLDGGSSACPCLPPFTCVPQGQTGICAQATGLCGHAAALGDPAVLVDPSQWQVASTCNPGTDQRYCSPPVPDAGTPVFCAQGFGEDLSGMCLALCKVPGQGTTPEQTHPCPDGFHCSTEYPVLFDVVRQQTTCVTDRDCLADAGEQCVGPLPAFTMGYRCGLPYGLCIPGSGTDGGN